MSNINQDIAAVKAKISDLEDRIEAAEKNGRSENYILSLRSELIELRKEKNILLLEKSNQIVTVGKLSYIY